MQIPDRRHAIRVRGRAGCETVRRSRLRERRIVCQGEPALAHLHTKQVRHPLRVPAQQVEDETLEVRRTGNIHRRAGGLQRLRGAAHPVLTGAEELVQHVVLVRRDDQSVDRQAHLLGDVARADVAEVTGRHGEADLLIIRLRQLQPGGDVVYDLGHQARPVDGVHRTDAVIPLEIRIRGHGLHHVLAVIEDPVQGDVEDIRVIQTEHLSLLERRHAPGRGQHEHADPLAATHRVLRRRARVTAGRAQDVQGLAAAGQLVLKQLAEQLHGHVLKRGRRPLREVAEVHAVLELRDGDDLLVRKSLRRIRPGRDGLQLLRRDVVHKDLQYLGSQRGIALLREQLAPLGEDLVAQLRVLGGQVEATVRGQATQQDVRELGGGMGRITSRNVVHVSTS